MASMIETFPAEIISSIISILAHDATMTLDERQNGSVESNALKACSLACHAFLPHCREHVFRSIRISDSSSRKYTTRQFVQLITDTPEIAGYIRKLDYEIIIIFHDKSHYAAPVTTALDQLTKLESLVLRTLSYERGWTDIPSSTVSSLLRLIRLPMLSSLELTFFEKFNISDLIPCPNLHNLHFNDVSFMGEDKNKSKGYSKALLNVPIEPIRPRELRLNYPFANNRFSSILEQNVPLGGKPILDLSELRKIMLSISREEDLLFAKAILARTHRLEFIELSVHLFVNPLAKSAVSSVLKPQSLLATLKSLCLNLYIYERPFDPLFVICEVLEEITGKNQIELLKIRITMYSGAGSVGSKWGDLERALLAPGWSSLRQVDLYIVFDKGANQDEIINYKRLPETQLSLLSSSQSLKFVFNAMLEFL